MFEFGSGYGYSAYWFARAVGGQGQVICTDGDPLNKEKAQEFLSAASLCAMSISIPEWRKPFLHKPMAYSTSATTTWIRATILKCGKAKERLRPGGLYIADNVLWHGRVAMAEYENIVPGWTEAIHEHNEQIFADPDFDAFINPTRDGVIVARKKA